MKLVLLGPPGAGKGTHAKILEKNHHSKQLAAGDILRQNIKEQTELGKKAKDVIERGELVSDDLVNSMMIEQIRAVGTQKGFILDGYPRTIGQADALDCFLKEENTQLDAVLNFETSEKVIIDRLSGRRICLNCGGNYHLRNIPPKKEGICDNCGEKLTQRKDDKPDTIKHRLETYQKETAPLIDYYKAKGLLHDVTGDFDVKELQDELKGLFEKLGLAVA